MSIMICKKCDIRIDTDYEDYYFKKNVCVECKIKDKKRREREWKTWLTG